MSRNRFSFCVIESIANLRLRAQCTPMTSSLNSVHSQSSLGSAWKFPLKCVFISLHSVAFHFELRWSYIFCIRLDSLSSSNVRFIITVARSPLLDFLCTLLCVSFLDSDKFSCLETQLVQCHSSLHDSVSPGECKSQYFHFVRRSQI